MTPRSDAAPKRPPAVKPRRVLEDVAVPVQLVAPYPVTVTQRTCLEWFGLSKADYLRLVGRGAFPVKAEGQLRIARFVDVETFETYVTSGTTRRRARAIETREPAPAVDPVAAVDVDALLYKAGFRKITDPEESREATPDVRSTWNHHERRHARAAR